MMQSDTPSPASQPATTRCPASLQPSGPTDSCHESLPRHSDNRGWRPMHRLGEMNSCVFWEEDAQDENLAWVASRQTSPKDASVCRTEVCRIKARPEGSHYGEP